MPIQIDPLVIRIAAGLVLSWIVAAIARSRGMLSPSGAWGAVITGTLVFGFGGLVRGLLLVAFFASSSLLSRYRRAAKESFAQKFDKGSERDLGQTLANGGVAALLCVPMGLPGSEPAWYPVLALAFYGALATANADTWATELGVLAPGRPRLITTGADVDPGTSGGITRQGTLAALAGAAFIGLAGFALIQAASLATSGEWLLADWIVVPVAAIAGLAGALFDSVLGATVQAIYYCDTDGVETERRVHSCGQGTRRIRGWSWMNNDWVNFIASAFGAGVAGLLAALIF